MEYRNYVSIDKNTDKVLKAKNKDEKNNYIIPFPKILTRFIHDPNLTPQSLLIKPRKKYRPIWDETYIIDHNSKCINIMMDNKKELAITY